MNGEASLYARDISQITGAAATATALGIAAYTGSTLGAAAATTGPETLGIGAAVAGLVALTLSFFKGANPAQVPTSIIEQAYEAASQNLEAVFKAGMISSYETIKGFDIFRQAGIISLQRFPSTVVPAAQAQAQAAALRGIKNITNALAVSDATRAAPNQPATRPLSLAAARLLYLKPGTSGWYKDSLTHAGLLTDQYLRSLPEMDYTEALLAGSGLSTPGLPLSKVASPIVGAVAGRPTAPTPASTARTVSTSQAPKAKLSKRTKVVGGLAIAGLIAKLIGWL